MSGYNGDGQRKQMIKRLGKLDRLKIVNWNLKRLNEKEMDQFMVEYPK